MDNAGRYRASVNFFDDEHADTSFRYLSRQDVVRACAELDIVAVTAEALRQHTQGNSVLPEEAYLGWADGDGYPARCLAMPGGLLYPDRSVYGLKVINGSLGNVSRGIPRSQGLTMIFDPNTARPRAIMEAAYLSALRTAAVTVATALAISPAARTAAVIGCGTLAKAHLSLLGHHLADLDTVLLHDQRGSAAHRLADQFAPLARRHSIEVRVVTSAEEAVRNSDVVIAVTTVTEGYLAPSWIRPGALIAHVSLDDLLPAAIADCDVLMVDDWHLVRDDPRRLLGRMWRDGRLLGPGAEPNPEVTAQPNARAVDTTIGDVLLGRHPGRTSPDDIVVSNPFGMAILDVAVAEQVLANATELGLGRQLPV